MSYNLITRNGNLKFDAFIDSMTVKPKNGFYYGFRKMRSGKNDYLDVIKISDTDNDDTANSDLMTIKIDNAEYTSPNNDANDSSVRILLYNGKNGNFIMLKGSVEYKNWDSYTDIGQYRDIEILGLGKTSFTNVAIKFDSVYNRQNDCSRFIKMMAGASGSERKVYNFFDLQKGKYVFADFKYDIQYKDGKFTVHNSTSDLPKQYDEDGNYIEATENVIRVSGDNYRKISIGHDHIFEGYIFRNKGYYGHLEEFTIYKDYDYKKHIFVDPVCTIYGSAHVEYLGFDKEDGNTFHINAYEHGDFPVPSYHTSDSEFGSRYVDKVLANHYGDMFIYVTPRGELAYFTTDEMKEHIVTNADDPRKMNILQTSIIDYKLKDVFLNISESNFTRTNSYVISVMNGNVIYDHCDTIITVSYEDIFKKNGILQTRKDGETVFIQYKDGKITDIDLNGIIPSHIETRDKKLYITDKNDGYVHKYDDNMKCLDDDNFITQRLEHIENGSGYGFVQYDKTNKTYKISPSEFGFDGTDYFDLILNGEQYKPKNIDIIRSSGNRDYHNTSDIAFIASRYVDGQLKKTLFMNYGKDPLDPSNPRNGRKLFSIGEYDDIRCEDEYGRENYFYSGTKKSELERNRIIVTDGDKEQTYSLTINKDGELRTIKKKSRKDDD